MAGEKHDSLDSKTEALNAKMEEMKRNMSKKDYTKDLSTGIPQKQ